MRLIECHPKWWGQADPTARQGLGITFDCPLCVRAGMPSLLDKNFVRGTKGPFCAVLPLAFINPLDGGPAGEGNKTLWVRENATFETLTLNPSVDASRLLDGTPSWHDGPTRHLGWHGHILKGEIVGGL